MALSYDSRRRISSLIFFCVALWLLMQIGWWVYVFVDELENSAAVRRASVVTELEIKNIDTELARRRTMFLSESAFFALVTCFGLTVLFRTLRREQTAREQQHSFIEILTHESKTPLTVLKLQLESVRQKWGGRDHALEREVIVAEEEVARLVRTFEKAAGLNRIEREGLTLLSSSLTELVDQTMRRLTPFLRASDVSVSQNLQECVSARVDPEALTVCVQNLVENAVVHNDAPHKALTVNLFRDSQFAVLCVTDNGSGIARSERESIFKKFFRGKSSARIPGTGLGLYLVKTVVSAHGGTIEVAQGAGGCTFELRLPIGAV